MFCEKQIANKITLPYFFLFFCRGRGRDRMVQLPVQSVPIFTKVEPCSWLGILDTTLCDKVC